MPHESSLAQNISMSRSSVGKATESSHDPLLEGTERPQDQSSQHEPGFTI